MPPICLKRRTVITVFIMVMVILNLGNAASLYAIYAKGADFAFGIVPLFNFDEESNFPTLFNGLLLGMGALLAFAISFHLKHQGGPDLALSWKAIGLIMSYMMLDELCHVHESVGWIIMSRVDTSGAIDWPWVIPYAVLAVLVTAFFLRFFLKLEAKYRWRLAIAGGLYLFAALGLEMMEAAHTEKHGDTIVFGILYSIEETLEMTAVLIAILAYMSYAIDHCRGLDLKLRVS